MNKLFRLIIDESEYFCDITGRENLIFFLFTIIVVSLQKLIQHFLLQTIVDLFAERVIPNQIDENSVVFLGSKSHSFINDNTAQKDT